MKKRLLTLAGGILLVATVSRIITLPAVAQTIRAALVKNIDEKGRNPYQQSLDCVPQYNVCEVKLPSVPAGMRLVVESLNVQIAGIGLGTTRATLSSDGSNRLYFPGIYGFHDFYGRDNYFVSAPITVFADGGVDFSGSPVTPFVIVEVSSGTLNDAHVTVTGYLVNLNN